MERPRCRLCLEQHWPGEAHRVVGVVPRADVREFLRPRKEHATNLLPRDESSATNLCPVCGGVIPLSRTRPRKFCSDACRKARARR